MGDGGAADLEAQALTSSESSGEFERGAACGKLAEDELLQLEGEEESGNATQDTSEYDDDDDSNGNEPLSDCSTSAVATPLKTKFRAYKHQIHARMRRRQDREARCQWRTPEKHKKRIAEEDRKHLEQLRMEKAERESSGQHHHRARLLPRPVPKPFRLTSFGSGSSGGAATSARSRAPSLPEPPEPDSEPEEAETPALTLSQRARRARLANIAAARQKQWDQQ